MLVPGLRKTESGFLSSTQLLAWAGMRDVAPQPGSPILIYKGSGTCSASSQDNSPLAPKLLETAYLTQEEGGTMGTLVLQGQHPHFLLSQVRMRAQSQTLRGSAASA